MTRCEGEHEGWVVWCRELHSGSGTLWALDHSVEPQVQC